VCPDVSLLVFLFPWDRKFICVVVVIVVVCSPPFDAQTHAGLNVRIKEGKYRPLPPQFSDEMNKVVHVMLNIDV